MMPGSVPSRPANSFVKFRPLARRVVTDGAMTVAELPMMAEAVVVRSTISCTDPVQNVCRFASFQIS